MQIICSVAYFIFHKEIFTLCFQLAFQHTVYHVLSWTQSISISTWPLSSQGWGWGGFKKENRQQFHLHNLFSFGPPSHPCGGGHNTWAPSTKCQLTKSPGHRQKMQIQQLHSKAQTVSCENAPDQGASRKSERPHGTPFRHFISVMWACSFRSSATSFFSMFDFRRICVSRILTYMHIFIIIHICIGIVGVCLRLCT